jgi:hypothetical protein
VLTTLELDEAMRVLAGGGRIRALAAGASFAAAVVLVVLGVAGLLLGQ